jgi:hypothetical protein
MKNIPTDKEYKIHIVSPSKKQRKKEKTGIVMSKILVLKNGQHVDIAPTSRGNPSFRPGLRLQRRKQTTKKSAASSFHVLQSKANDSTDDMDLDMLGNATAQAKFSNTNKNQM